MKFFFNQTPAPLRRAGSALCAGFTAAATLPALGALLLAAPLHAQSPAPAPAVSAVPQPPVDERPETVISSDELDMVGGDDANHFYFRRNVRVQATNMVATCDELEVISARQSSKDGGGAAPAGGVPSGDAAANIGSIREIIMRGNVVISQEGRQATAGTAYLYPQDGRVVLADDPKVTDEQGTLSGWRMELYRGERKVRILSNPDEPQRTRVTLPALQDLGYTELGEPASGSAAATDGSAAPTQQSAPSAAAPAVAEGAATSPAATSSAPAATAPATSAAPAAGAATAAEPKAEEPAAPRRSGWNPVNNRR